MLRLNEPAPPVSLRNQYGVVTGLQQLRGHLIALWWQRTLAHKNADVVARSLRDRYADFTMRNAVIVGVSGDPLDDNRRFCERLNLQFDVLSDSAGHTGKAYQMAAWWQINPDLPLVLLIDANGVVRANHQVSDPTSLTGRLLSDVSHVSA